MKKESDLVWTEQHQDALAQLAQNFVWQCKL